MVRDEEGWATVFSADSGEVVLSAVTSETSRKTRLSLCLAS